MRVFTPDGAGDEQLAGLLASETFPNMVGVLRCVAHMATSAMEAGWKADPLVTEIQTQVVQEVAKYLRHSERFAQIAQAKADQQEIHVLANFAFAPHRFGSIERPLSRFLVLGKSVLEALAFDYEFHSQQSRRTWAQQILRQLQGETWLLIGMMADLADDCLRFIHKLDVGSLDAISCIGEVLAFEHHLRKEYLEGGMWRRQAGTYARRARDLLARTQAFTFGAESVIMSMPPVQTIRK